MPVLQLLHTPSFYFDVWLQWDRMVVVLIIFTIGSALILLPYTFRQVCMLIILHRHNAKMT